MAHKFLASAKCHRKSNQRGARLAGVLTAAVRCLAAAAAAAAAAAVAAMVVLVVAAASGTLPTTSSEPLGRAGPGSGPVYAWRLADTLQLWTRFCRCAVMGATLDAWKMYMC